MKEHITPEQKPEHILQKKKYKGLSNPVLICEAMEEFRDIKCFHHSIVPVRTTDAPEHSVTVAIIDEHGLDGLGWYDFEDQEWRFHTDTLVDYNEAGAPSEWRWYYIPVKWTQAIQNNGTVKVRDAQATIESQSSEIERLRKESSDQDHIILVLEQEIKRLREVLHLLKDSIDFVEQEHSANYVITAEDKKIIESALQPRK